MAGQPKHVLSRLASPLASSRHVTPGVAVNPVGFTTPSPSNINSPYTPGASCSLPVTASDILKDVVAYVEVRSKHENRSHAVEVQLQRLGATIEPKMSKKTTHVIFRSGKHSTWIRANKKGIPLISVLWIESCRQNNRLMPISEFAATLEETLTPVGLRKHLPKFKSMQPKNFEDEVANSMERLNRKQKRQAKADKWKVLQSPVTPLQFGVAGQFYVAESQPESPVGDESIHRNVTIPDTPPSMRAARSGFKLAGSTEEEDIPTSPSAVNFQLPLYRRLFNSSANNSPQSAKKLIIAGKLPSSDASPISPLSQDQTPEIRTPDIAPSVGNMELCRDKLTRDYAGSTDSCVQSEPMGQTSEQKSPGVLKKKTKRNCKMKLLPPVEEPLEKLLSPVVMVRNHKRKHILDDHPCDLVKKTNKSKGKASQDSDDSELPCQKKAKSGKPKCDSVASNSKKVTKQDYGGSDETYKKSTVKAVGLKAVPNRRRSCRLQSVNNMLLDTSTLAAADTGNVNFSSDSDSSVHQSKYTPLPFLSESEEASTANSSNSVSLLNSADNTVLQRPATVQGADKPLLKTVPRRRSTRITPISMMDNSTNGSDQEHISLFAKRRVTEEFQNSNLTSQKPNLIASSHKEKSSGNIPSRSGRNESHSSSSDSSSSKSGKCQRKKQNDLGIVQSANEFGISSNRLKSLVTTSLHFDEQGIVHSVAGQLGGFRVENRVSGDTSHVICGGLRRTLNVLYAVARGIWLVSMEWVLKSLEAGEWVDEAPYELHASFPAAKERRAERQDIFADCGRVYVGKDTSPPQADIVKLLQQCGGEITSCIRKAQLCIGKGLKCQVDWVTEAWVLDSIMANELLPKVTYNLHIS